MDNEERRSILLGMYDAFNARDLDRATEFLAPDVDWPNSMTGGREHGRAAVRAYWEHVWAQIDPVIEPIKVDFAADGNAHVRAHQLVKGLDGAILEDRKLEHIFTFDGAFVTRLVIIDEDPDPDADADDDENDDDDQDQS